MLRKAVSGLLVSHVTSDPGRRLGLAGLIVGLLLVAFGLFEGAVGIVVLGGIGILGSVRRVLGARSGVSTDAAPSLLLKAYQGLILLAFLAFGVGAVGFGVVKGGGFVLAGIVVAAIPLYAVFIGVRNAWMYCRAGTPSGRPSSRRQEE